MTEEEEEIEQEQEAERGRGIIINTFKYEKVCVTVYSTHTTM